MVVNMLQKWSYMYFSHNSNIKYIGLIIKYIKFQNRFIILLTWILFNFLWFLTILILYFYRCDASLNQ